MGRDVLSVRQMMVLLLVALLAPVTDLLPTVAAQRVGQGGWLIGLGALPVLLLAFWSCSKVFCKNEICAMVGKPVGYTITIIYMVWILFALAATLRLSAARMEVIYSKVPSVLFAVFLAAVAAWMGMGKTSALARAAEIFYLALALLLAVVLLLASFKIEWKNLYPVVWRELPAGSAAAAGICLNIAPAAILGARVPRKTRSVRRACGWIITFCAAVVLVVAAVLGSIGSGLSARLDIPYLIMVQGLGIKGAFQRTEALVAATWLLSDVILAGVLLCAWQKYATQLKSEKWGKWSVPGAALVALVVGWLLFSDKENVRMFYQDVLSVVGIILGLFVPIVLLLISYVRGKGRR